jgi:hypothetical protein
LNTTLTNLKHQNLACPPCLNTLTWT